MLKPMQDLDFIDLRLLRLFEAIYATRHITRAADQLALSQPTLSIGLGKLRTHFGDALFVRTADGMLPTPQADALIGPVRDVLQSLRTISRSEQAFDPATAMRAFRICMTDASHITLLPRLLGHIRRVAPGVQLQAARIDGAMPQALQNGDADLALGLVPELDAAFYQQTLYQQDWICLCNRSHARIRKSISLAAYKREGHVNIVGGTGQNLLDAALQRASVTRRVLLQMPGFLGLPAILATSDLIATLPRQIGETLAQLGGLAVHACPVPIETFAVKQHWHTRYHHDAANRWLRSVCAGLFLK
jgi:DNA-binding transcriptional LysR family regulator